MADLTEPQKRKRVYTPEELERRRAYDRRRSRGRKRVYTEEQRKRRRAYNLAYHYKNKDRFMAKAKIDWINRDRTHERNMRRKRRYGLLPGQWEMLAAEQGGVCALCRVKPPVDVDHCHKTKRVRALLCRGCNLGIGFFGDSIERLTDAIAYLKR